MGLDITAYAGFKTIPTELVECDEDGYPTGDIQRFTKSLIEYTERSFPGRTAGLEPDLFYEAEDSFGFRAGSYSGYSSWRQWLSQLAGYGSAEAVWGNPGVTGPFIELINFSDCEGVIGPATAAKLAKDFSDFQAKAEAQSDVEPFYIEAYRSWRKAFEMAANSGAVVFH